MLLYKNNLLLRSFKAKFRLKDVWLEYRRSQGGAQGARAPPIKIPLTTKSYDNIAGLCLVAVFFSLIAHITVINKTINDNK